MNIWRIKASRMMIITRGSRVVFTEGQRAKWGTVIAIMHDKFKIACDDGWTRSILKERVEGLTPPDAQA